MLSTTDYLSHRNRGEVGPAICQAVSSRRSWRKGVNSSEGGSDRDCHLPTINSVNERGSHGALRSQPSTAPATFTPTATASATATGHLRRQQRQRLLQHPRRAATATATPTATATIVPTTLSVAPATGVYGGTVTLTATLTRTDDSSPISGKTISFTLNGNPVGMRLPIAAVWQPRLTPACPESYPARIHPALGRVCAG